MTTFSDSIDAQLAGPTVRDADLAFLDFRSQPYRLWSGFGNLRLPDGTLWTGAAGIGAISQVEFAADGSVGEVELQLFGNEGLLASIEADAADVVGRDVELSAQFFDVRRTDAAGNWVDWAPLGDPVVYFVGTMGPPKVRRAPAGEQGWTRSITVSALSALVNRARPAFGYCSDRDQRSRGDGTDAIFARIVTYADAVVSWPRSLT